jgi:hypothetical protein
MCYCDFLLFPLSMAGSDQIFNRSNVLRLFVKYDTENSGRLTKEQLEKALKVVTRPPQAFRAFNRIFAFFNVNPKMLSTANQQLAALLSTNKHTSAKTHRRSSLP